jgi:hypothetical protein
MFVVLGLIILVAAVVVGVAGVFNNVGSGHALAHSFSVFGYHVTGSTGALFLYGIVIGAAAILGLGLLLAGARRTSRRGRAARRELKQSRGQTAVSQDRDLIGQRESAQAETARSERAHADETARSETAHADETTRAKIAHADETTRSETAHADETTRAKTARADETTRSERAHADETTRSERARADDARARADETARAKTARADETARAKTARADEATRAQQNSLPHDHHDPGQGG